MKLNGYTQIGLMTAMIILFFQLILVKFNAQNSSWVGVQYLILFAGVFVSVFLYNKENKLVLLDLFMIGFRTISAAVVALVIGHIAFYFIFPHPKELKFTYALMPVVFSFGLSGVLSTLASAIIVNKLLQKS